MLKMDRDISLVFKYMNEFLKYIIYLLYDDFKSVKNYDPILLLSLTKGSGKTPVLKIFLHRKCQIVYLELLNKISYHQ